MIAEISVPKIHSLSLRSLRVSLSERQRAWIFILFEILRGTEKQVGLIENIPAGATFPYAQKFCGGKRSHGVYDEGCVNEAGCGSTTSRSRSHPSFSSLICWNRMTFVLASRSDQP